MVGEDKELLAAIRLARGIEGFVTVAIGSDNAEGSGQ